jgi:hypothetical protein
VGHLASRSVSRAQPSPVGSTYPAATNGSSGVALLSARP